MEASSAPTNPGPAPSTCIARASGANRPRLFSGVALGFAVGGVAFLLGCAILAAVSRSAGGGSTGDLQSEIASLREELARCATGPGAIPVQIQELKTQLAKLSSQMAGLERTLSAGGPARVAELERALREAEEARRAGENALLERGMRGPLMVFKDAARKVVKDGAGLERDDGPGPGLGTGPRKPPAPPQEPPKDF